MMRLTIESTNTTTDFEGFPVRLWKGRTEDGTECLVFVHRVAVERSQDCTQFERELEEHVQPSLDQVIPLRMIV